MGEKDIITKLQALTIRAEQNEILIKTLQEKVDMLSSIVQENTHKEAEGSKTRRHRKENDLLPDEELLARLKKLIATKKRLTQNYIVVNQQEMMRDIAAMLDITQLRLKHLLTNAGPSVTLNSLICQCRVEKSCKLMAEFPHYTIETIAKESGFNNMMTFYRWFHIVMDCTPKAYMEKVNPPQQPDAEG